MIYIDDSEPEGELEPAFPYRDVTIKRGVDAHELFEILSEVGRGKFGTVYRCQEKSTGIKLAAKFVPIPKRDDKRNVEREVEIMNSLQHHLIIQLYAAYEYQKMMCVVLELVEGGELFDRVVDDEFVLTERVCVVFIRQVCEAMEFIHRNNILHLDLKPENILCLTQEGNRIKLIDFGLARKFDPDKRLQILFGTPEFVAPEVVNFDCISYGTDMWSVGVICYVLISGLSPFMGETDIETMANVTIAKYDFEDESFSNVSQECLDFIAKLLVKDLSIRMTAVQCLEHKWLQQRPKAPPIVSPKPINIPPPKLKAATPSPTIAAIPDDENNEEEILPDVDDATTTAKTANVETSKELDTTKDNLKNFIERWEEHPNSPYVFDVDNNVIAPLSETNYKKPHGADSISSSRVCSPSPCESIETITDDDDGNKAIFDNDDSPNSPLATPINESREKLFPSGGNGASGATTPTPSQYAIQYAPQHLFDRKYDELTASETNLQQRSIKSYLHTFDRRNSDTNYLITRRSSGERINLADEIRKLSDHLLMLAEINTKLGNEAKKEGAAMSVVDKFTNDANNNTSSNYVNKNSSSSCSISKKSAATTKTKDQASHSKSTSSTVSSKTNASSISNRKTATNSSSSSMKTSTNSSIDATADATTTSSVTTSASSSSNLIGNNKSKASSLSVRLQQSIEETPKLTNGTVSGATWKTTKKSTVNTITTANAKSNASFNSKTKTTSSSSITSTAATSTSSSSSSTTDAVNKRRAKFRINQMSRDVPIGLPNQHQAVNLEEAANTTKDCLLHLLEKYNESKCRNPLSRHQSISVDWNMSDNLEYRSMSSINAFFQRHNNSGRHVRQLQAQLEGKESGKSPSTPSEDS